MRSCLALLCCLYSALASAQTLVVDARGQAPGVYWLELTVTADGQLTGRVVGNVLRLAGEPAPAPAPPDVPTTPSEPPAAPSTLDSPMARASFSSIKRVTDPISELTRLQLAILYREIREHVGKEFQAPWDRLAIFTRLSRMELLGEEGEKQWAPWVEAVSAEFRALEAQAPNKQLAVDQVKGAYGQLIIGLEHQPDGAVRRGLDPATRQLIVRIVRLIIEQLLSGQGAAKLAA